MQICALNDSGQLVPIQHARRGHSYCCLECGKEVRPRNSRWIQPHFFHIPSLFPCRQKEKTAVHLCIQKHLKKVIGEGLALEVPFRSISRIADAVWESEKIVFEVQVSPMSADEMRGRVADYRSQGYETVWILSDKLYNRPRLSAMEEALKSIPHYYSNIDSHGQGIVYDQWAVSSAGLRKKRGALFPIIVNEVRRPFGPCAGRNWPLGFQGDIGSRSKDSYHEKTPLHRLEIIRKGIRAFLRWLPLD